MGPIFKPPQLMLDPDGLQLQAGTGLAKSLHVQLKHKILQGSLSSSHRLPASPELAPKPWLPTWSKLRVVLDRHASIVDQHVLADFIEQGHFLRHVRRMRRSAAARRDAFVQAWQQDLAWALPLPSRHWEEALIKRSTSRRLVGGRPAPPPWPTWRTAGGPS